MSLDSSVGLAIRSLFSFVETSIKPSDAKLSIAGGAVPVSFSICVNVTPFGLLFTYSTV